MNNNQTLNHEILNRVKKIYSELNNIPSFNKNRAKILYLDDEIKNLKSFQSLFRREYLTTIVNTANEAYNLLENNEYHIILTDQKMPGTTGTEFFKNISSKHPNSIRIILSGYTELQIIKESIKKGDTCHYLTKPWKLEEMKKVIDTAHELIYTKERYQHLLESEGNPNIGLGHLLQCKSNP